MSVTLATRVCFATPAARKRTVTLVVLARNDDRQQRKEQGQWQIPPMTRTWVRNTQNSESVAKRFVEYVIAQGRMDVADEVLDPELIVYVPIARQPIRGREHYKQFLASFAAAFPDGLQVTLDDAFGVGDRAVARFTARGVHGGPLLGAAASGNHLTIGETHMLHMRDGRIIEDVVSDTTADLPLMVGVVERVA